jgi:ketosteroid isomerase-like protein
MKKYILTLLSLFIVSSSVLADDKQEALNFFNSYVNAANNYSPTVAEMYSPSAKIIRQVVKPDGTTVDVATDTATYIKQMKIGQAGAKLRHYKNTYTNIVATPVEGAFKVASMRQPSGEDYKLKAYMIVKKQPNGEWLIIEEMMQTKVQTFLKYADKK